MVDRAAAMVASSLYKKLYMGLDTTLPPANDILVKKLKLLIKLANEEEAGTLSSRTSGGIQSHGTMMDGLFIHAWPYTDMYTLEHSNMIIN